MKCGGGWICRAIPAWETCTPPSQYSLAASGSNMAASVAAASRSIPHPLCRLTSSRCTMNRVDLHVCMLPACCRHCPS